MKTVPKSVAEVMTRDVAALNENDSLANLQASLDAMLFRHLPVTDGDRLVGLLTERDLLALSASSLSPHRLDQDHALMDRFYVRDVMQTNVTTVKPETSLAEAGRILLSQRFGCLPVVDDANVLRGILTTSDFVRVVVEYLAER